METMNLSNINTAFLDHLKELGKSERTIYTYRKDLDIVEAFFGGDKPITEIRNLQIGKFFKADAMLLKPNGTPRAERTIEKTVRVFRMMLVWAFEKEFITELPLPKNTPMGNSLKQNEPEENREHHENPEEVHNEDHHE